MKTVDELLSERDWKPIPHCRGRYTLAEQKPDLTVADLLGEECRPVEIPTVMARDRVLVVGLEDGGMISYRRSNGQYVHTLNTRDGFWRKLKDLGIDHRSFMTPSEP